MREALDTSKAAIARRLSAVREARGLTQGALASALGLSAQRWNNYELGRTAPPPAVLAKLWQVTGATSDYILFERIDGMPFELVQLMEGSLAEKGKRA